MHKRKVWMLREEEVNGSEDEDDFRIGAIEAGAGIEGKDNAKWDEVVSISGILVKCKLDTGADVPCLPHSLDEYLMERHKNLKARSVSTRLCSYFGDKYPCRSVVELAVEYRKRRSTVRFYVLEMEVMPTLSGRAAEALGLIARVGRVSVHSRQAHPSTVPEEKSASTVEDMELRGWMKKFPTAFEGEGNISGYKCHISLKHNYKAVANTCRPIPVHARELLERSWSACSAEESLNVWMNQLNSSVTSSS